MFIFLCLADGHVAVDVDPQYAVDNLISQGEARVGLHRYEMSIDTDWLPSDGLKYLTFAYASYCPKDIVIDWNCSYCISPQGAQLNVSLYTEDPDTDTLGLLAIDVKHHESKWCEDSCETNIA